jgi:hypothetical protein
VASAVFFRPLGFGTLYVPAAITAATGAGYWLYCRYRHVAMDAIGRGSRKYARRQLPAK